MEMTSSVVNALYLLQKFGVERNLVNLTQLTNKFVILRGFQVNMMDVVSTLYYVQDTMKTVEMTLNDSNDPTWSIREDVFKSLSL